MSTGKDTQYCSFCGKSIHEIEKLISGPTAYICNECVDLCQDIIKEETKAPKSSALTTENENAQLKKALKKARKIIELLITSRSSEIKEADAVLKNINTILTPEPPSSDGQPDVLSI